MLAESVIYMTTQNLNIDLNKKVLFDLVRSWVEGE
jgi:hypothetical protein